MTEEYKDPEELKLAIEQLGSARKLLFISLVLALTSIPLMFVGKSGTLGIVLHVIGSILGLLNIGTVAEYSDTNKLLRGISYYLLLFPVTNLIPVGIFALIAGRKIADGEEELRKARLRAHKQRRQASARTNTPSENSGDLSSIFPMIKIAGLQNMPEYQRLQVSTAAAAGGLGTSEPVALAIKGTFGVMYARDIGDQLAYLSIGEVAQLGLSLPELHQHAIRNLSVKLKQPGSGLGIQPLQHSFGLTLDGHFESSLVLLDDLWNGPLKSRTPNGPVVTIAARDICAFCDRDSVAGLQEIQGVSARVSAGGDHLINAQLFARQSDGTWVKYPAAR